MLANPFTPASKEGFYLRMAMVGPSGSGKTWTALTIASQMAALAGGKIAVLDTEGGSSDRYKKFFKFDRLILSKNFSPQEYINAINAAAYHDYSVIVVDSFTHAWNGAGGVLDIADKAGQSKGGNKFAGWSIARPAQNSLAEAVLNAPIHIIGTMRSKTEYVLQPDPRTGKDKPVKMGLAPVQSEDFEYEFDVVVYMDMDHQMTVTKTRCPDLDKLQSDDTAFVSNTLYAWTTDGDIPVNPAKLAKNVLATDEGKADFRAFLTALNIGGNGASKPYLTALGCKDGFSEYSGAYDDMKAEIQTIHDALNAPQADDSADAAPAVDPIVEQAAAQITAAQAAESLAHKPGRIETKDKPAVPTVAETVAIIGKLGEPPITDAEAVALVTGAAKPSPFATDSVGDQIAQEQAAHDNDDIPATATNPHYRRSKQPAD